MEHNRASHIKKRPYNVFAKTKWNTPAVSDLHKALMYFNPSASWNRDPQFRPMHWDPNENWNHNLTVADMMNKDSSTFYDNISRSLPSEGDVVYVNEGGKTRKHSIKRRKNRKVRKSRKH